MRAVRLLLVALLGGVAWAQGPPPPQGGDAQATGAAGPPRRRPTLFPATLPPDRDSARPPDATVQREAREAAVQREAREAAGSALVTSGRVPPAWRQIERGIRDLYRPPLDAVSSAPRAVLLAGQALRNAPEGPPRTRAEPMPPAGGGSSGQPAGAIDLDEQLEATNRANRRPLEWRQVEVAVIARPDGGVESLRVERSSGSARLDQLALEAVGRTLERTPPRDSEGLREARFRLSAAVAMVPLDINAVGAPQQRSRGRGAVAKLRFQFDESAGSIRAEKPFSEELRTEVRLVSLARGP